MQLNIALLPEAGATDQWPPFCGSHRIVHSPMCHEYLSCRDIPLILLAGLYPTTPTTVGLPLIMPAVEDGEPSHQY